MGALFLVVAWAGSGGVACVGARPPAHPGDAPDPLAASFSQALAAEQSNDGQAVAAHLALVEAGLSRVEDGPRTVLAGLDGLLWRETMGLGRAGAPHALAFRVPEALGDVEARLKQFHEAGRGHPLAREFIGQALLDVARFRGDAAAATRWRAASGAIQKAVVVGPLSAAPLTGPQGPTALETGALRESYPGVGPFVAAVRPVSVEAEDGVLDTGAASAQPGLYAVVVDVQVPRPQRVWVTAQTTAGAVLAAGGRAVLARPYQLGGAPVLRAGWVDAGAGTLRLVLRVGFNDDGGRVALAVVGDDGAPLAHAAPAVGESATAAVQGVGGWEIPLRRGPSLELSAASLMALGDARAARRLLEDDAASPGAALLYARALNKTDDSPENRRIERARAAYGRVLEAWPHSWEAQVGSSLYASARKGPAEGRIEALRDLARARADGKAAHPLVRAFEAGTAVELGVRDVALAAFAELKTPLAGTPLLAALDERVNPRIGAEAEAFVCASPQLDRQSLGCLQTRMRRGDFKGAFAELSRLRELRGSPRALLSQELSLRIAEGDRKAVISLYDSLYPGQRSLALLGLLDDAAELRQRADRDRTSARDAPGALSQLAPLLEADRIVALENEGRKLIEQDRKDTSASTSATLVLLHDERYDLAPDGLLRAVIHDVRKVSGTTDVEQGVGNASFSLVGRDLRRVLRRKIHKRDGRVLEPDRAAMASQGNADLSQLEPGDYIEQIVDAWVLPDKAGHLVIDTPDLLPERTGVRRAVVELRHPKALKLARWSHALMGRPDERDEGDRHVVSFRIDNASPRHIEEGAPRMDRDVSFSFGTYSWADVARHVAEFVHGLGDDDPYLARWAAQAAGDVADRRVVVERVVAAAGKAIRVPQGNLLTDTSAALSAGPQSYTARHILELGQGSRTWVVYRALQSLKIPAEIVIAEREPFSADASFPPRPSRFDRPLVVAHLADGDVWIDADIPGPPLPAGRVSPELRGRQALRLGGEMVPVQGASAEGARDEIEIALKIDERGDARGTFTIQLGGRPAQAITDALDRTAGSERRDLLRGVVLGWMPWATVNDVQLTSAENTSPLALKAEVAIPSFAQGEGKLWVLPGIEPLHAVFPRPTTSTIGAAYAARMGRQTALAIDSSFQFRVRRSIELPAGWKPAGALPQGSVKHDLLDASRSSKLSGSRIDEEFSLSLTSGTVAADAYERFAAQAKRADDTFLAGLRLQR